MSNFLDANSGQIAQSSAGVADASSMFATTLHNAESTAMQAQAFHAGESSAAFQQSHARFVSGATKLNNLLNMAGLNVGEAGQTYVGQDAAGAQAMQSVPIGDGGGIAIRG